MAIPEKADYIAEFGRMPYMPSAEEVDENGLDLGEGIAGITRNVEENTLDLIDLYERLIKLEQSNKEKEEEIEVLIKQVQLLKQSK